MDEEEVLDDVPDILHIAKQEQQEMCALYMQVLWCLFERRAVG
jgi:hypothetical protein